MSDFNWRTFRPGYWWHTTPNV